jgi:hypothetical protein
MNKIIFTFLLTGGIHFSQAQYIGIGTPAITYPLTVAPNSNGMGAVQKDGTVEIGLYSSLNATGVLKTLSNHPLHFATNNSTVPSMTIGADGNVGIGLAGAEPLYKLDMEGRIRIRHTTNTAGIWFDGTAFTPRSFIGTIDNNYVGFWGDGGAGWNIAMNVQNGFTGIGTTAPTATLDLNGTLRIRDNSVKTGSTFLSADANGNGEWQVPVAFRAQGSADGNPVSVPASTWTKVIFNPTTPYNAGLTYQPLASQFVAPVRGIYHFGAQTTWINRRFSVGIGLAGTRNGVSINTLPYYTYENGRALHNGTYYTSIKANIESMECDVKLEAGDIIWLIVYRTSGDDLSGDATKTWFTGRLVTPF